MEEVGANGNQAKTLMAEIDNRFEIMSKPCVEAIGRKLQLKLSENIQAFRQIPNRLVGNKEVKVS